MRRSLAGCVLLLSFAAIGSALDGATKVEVVPHKAAEESKWNEVDAELLVKGPSQPQQLAMEDWLEDGYEPYSDELDAYVTDSGVPDPLNDDSARHNRYENWLRNYKRIPNEKPVPWSYENADSGPDVWSSLNKNYKLCDPDLTGAMSSPIDIVTMSAVPTCYGPSYPLGSGPAWENAQATITEAFDRSFYLEVQHCTQECKICEVKCTEGPYVPESSEHKRMKLDRIIFHTPSEHLIDSSPLDMEMQFMHCLADEISDHIPCTPKLAMAILFKDGGDSVVNPDWIVKLLGTLKDVGTDPKELAKGLDFSELNQALSPLLSEYYSYMGSQTYPPCYLGVQWMISKSVITLSTSAIEGFKMRQGANVRPNFMLGRRVLTSLRPETADHWTYQGPRGQAWWPSLKEYASCGNGAEDCEKLPDQKSRDICIADSNNQSPVDLYTNECMANVNWGKACVEPVGLRPLIFELGQSNNDPMKVLLKDCDCLPCNNENNAYTLTLEIPGQPTMTYENSIYTLREITFHTPSEHSIDGSRKAMEIQFLMDRTGCVGNGAGQCVTPNNNEFSRLHYAILFETGDSTPQWVSRVANVASSAKGYGRSLIPDLRFRDISVNIHSLLSTYYIYEGSQTTPPCKSKVTWLVMKTVLPIKADDLKMIQNVHVGNNARQLKDLNGRKISVAGTTQF